MPIDKPWIPNTDPRVSTDCLWISMDTPLKSADYPMVSMDNPCIPIHYPYSSIGGAEGNQKWKGVNMLTLIWFCCGFVWMSDVCRWPMRSFIEIWENSKDTLTSCLTEIDTFFRIAFYSDVQLPMTNCRSPHCNCDDMFVISEFRFCKFSSFKHFIQYLVFETSN